MAADRGIGFAHSLSGKAGNASAGDAPFYKRVRNDLEEKIKIGHYRAGDFIPSEANLEAEYQVSRTTIRNAIRSLVDDGYLAIIRGKGTRVVTSKLASNVPNLMSFTDVIQQQARTHSIVSMSIRRVRAGKEVAKKLGVAPDEEVTQFYRVRAVDNVPITIHDSYLPTKYLGNISEKLLREKVSLYNVLREDYGIVIQSGHDQITAEIADEAVARILGISKGDPILHMERTAYDQNNMIIEYSSVLYRGDRYTHTIVTKRNDI